MDIKQEVAQAMQEARERTWLLVSGMDDQTLASAACNYLSPPVWDLGHMANFEERWLVQELEGCQELRPGFNQIYNAFENPRHVRPSLKLLDREGARQYMQTVRDRAVAKLATLDLECSKLTRDGFVHWMLVVHEDQHQETLLQTLQMQGAQGVDVLPGPVRRLPDPEPTTPQWMSVPGGNYTIGREHGPGSYDNEAPPHTRYLEPFEVAKFPVTVGEFCDFVEAGGYSQRSLWSERGWAWREEQQVDSPLYWQHEGGAWLRSGPGCRVPVRQWPHVVLSHVSYFEAEAYACWKNARLPTEFEWEAAAAGVPAATPENANIDQLAFAPSQIGSYATQSSCGLRHVLGDVWEWTSSPFAAYDGFSAFPYDEYSKVFFDGDYRVLRGGSWATRARCATTTFRNWDHPYRRQIFAGIRLARDAAP